VKLCTPAEALSSTISLTVDRGILRLVSQNELRLDGLLALDAGSDQVVGQSLDEHFTAENFRETGVLLIELAGETCGESRLHRLVGIVEIAVARDHDELVGTQLIDAIVGRGGGSDVDEIVCHLIGHVIHALGNLVKEIHARCHGDVDTGVRLRDRHADFSHAVDEKRLGYGPFIGGDLRQLRSVVRDDRPGVALGIGVP
jgi:hypothetical protein